MNVTEIPLQLLHNIRSDIYKHGHIRLYFQGALASFYIEIMLCYIYKKKCPYGSYRVESSTLAVSKIELFVTIAKCPVTVIFPKQKLC